MGYSDQSSKKQRNLARRGEKLNARTSVIGDQAKVKDLEQHRVGLPAAGENLPADIAQACCTNRRPPHLSSGNGISFTVSPSAIPNGVAQQATLCALLSFKDSYICVKPRQRCGFSLHNLGADTVFQEVKWPALRP
jgi:hypothetical protein